MQNESQTYTMSWTAFEDCMVTARDRTLCHYVAMLCDGHYGADSGTALKEHSDPNRFSIRGDR